jgi:CDP-glucose 4,6-dehydratase
VHADIRNLDDLRKVFQEFEPEIVFHMAAQSLVRISYQNPVETFETNVMGTVHLLECVRQTPSVRSVVVVTSDKCYENKHWPYPYRESDSLGGHDPYSASKACAELAASSFVSAFFLPSASKNPAPFVATARAGNVIGGGDWAVDRLLPDMIRSFSSGHSARIRNPGAIRPWQHVLEPLRGYIILAQALFERSPISPGAWNFGPAAESVQPVRWIVNWASQAWGQDARWETDEAEHVHEAATLTLDSSKAAYGLGWRPALDLQSALHMTLDWYRQFLKGADARNLCLQQIESYTAHVNKAVTSSVVT